MMQSSDGKRNQKRESGAALIIAVLLMVVLGMMGIYALQTVSINTQVAGYQVRKDVSLYAADAAISDGMDAVRSLGSAGSTSTKVTAECITGSENYVGSLGDSSMFPADRGGQPQYTLDDKICYLGDSIESCEAEGAEMSMEVGAVALRRAMWVIQATGYSGANQGGSTVSKVSAVVSVCGAF